VPKSDRRMARRPKCATVAYITEPALPPRPTMTEQLDLADEEKRALIGLRGERSTKPAIRSHRLDPLKAILAKLDPPPLRPGMGPTHG
jgi:hypothetical protein